MTCLVLLSGVRRLLSHFAPKQAFEHRLEVEGYCHRPGRVRRSRLQAMEIKFHGR